MKKFWDKWTEIALVKRILVGLILGAILGIAVPQYMQEKSSAKEEYTPPFDLEGI